MFVLLAKIVEHAAETTLDTDAEKRHDNDDNRKHQHHRALHPVGQDVGVSAAKHDIKKQDGSGDNQRPVCVQSEHQLKHLFRLFWFTVEFGMIRENGALKAFGAGIMSSPSEAKHATSGQAELLPFELMSVLRTDYRIDIVQPIYFVIDSFEQLVAALETDMGAAIDEAARLGDLPARFDAAA